MTTPPAGVPAGRVAGANQFLESILARPGDTTARLVYADYLDDHGGDHARAEFIRLQVKLAGRGRPLLWSLSPAPVGADERREAELLLANWQTWLGSMPGYTPRLVNDAVGWQAEPGDAAAERVRRGDRPEGHAAGFVEAMFGCGFVAAVAVRPELLCDRECGGCHGAGVVLLPGRGRVGLTPCEACQGHRVVPPFAPAATALHPIREAVLPNKRPDRRGHMLGVDGQSLLNSWWGRGTGDRTLDAQNLSPASTLPVALFDRLSGAMLFGPDGTVIEAWYESPKAAGDSLRDAVASFFADAAPVVPCPRCPGCPGRDGCPVCDGKGYFYRPEPVPEATP